MAISSELAIEIRRQTGLRNRQRARREVLNILGDLCVCCGEDNLAVLEIDHVHNDGAEERTKSLRDITMFAKGLRTGELDKDRYQLLCANCHTAKTHGIICIHCRAEAAVEALCM